MHNVYKMDFILSSIILITLPIVCKTHDAHWVDPHEMTVSNMDMSKSDKQDWAETKKEFAEISFTLQHYKRLLTFLLNNAAFDDKSSSYRGQLNLDISMTDYKVLLHFINDAVEEDAAVLRKVDQIVNRILARSKYEEFSLFIITWTDYIYFTFYNRSTGILLSCLFLLLISYKLLKSNFTLWSVAKYLIFIGWVIDFAFNWIRLLQEAEIHKLADAMRYEGVPVHCNPGKMSFWQYLWYSIGTNEECHQYHRTIYQDAFWSVAPLQVLSYQLGIVVYTPATHIGRAVGSFSSGLLTSLPWGVNVVLFPSLLLFTLLIVGILLSFSTETSFQFNLFHLLNFHFGNREREAVGDVLTGRNLNAVLDVLLHRNMIEDVSPPKTSQAENTEQCVCSSTTEKAEVIKSIETNIPEKVSENKNIKNETHDETGDH